MSNHPFRVWSDAEQQWVPRRTWAQRNSLLITLALAILVIIAVLSLASYALTDGDGTSAVIAVGAIALGGWLGIIIGRHGG